MTILTSAQSAIRSAHENAMRMRSLGEWRDADLIDETLARAFFTFANEAEPQTPAVRIMGSYLDAMQPLAIDTLAVTEYAVPCVRIKAALAVPDLEELGALDQLREAIRDAIMVGAPLYNNGDPRSCGIIYWATALALVSMPATRGFAGQARALKPLRLLTEDPTTLVGRDPRSVDDFAWRTRQALDAALAVNG